MGAWEILRQKTKYDSLSFEEREKVRQEYIEDMEKYYTPAQSAEFLEKSGAYAKEREVDSPENAAKRDAEKQRRLAKVREIAGDDPFLSMSLGAKATADLELPDYLKSPERLAKERIALREYDSDAELNRVVEAEKADPSAFKAGVRESYLATRDIKNLAPDQRRAVLGAIQESRQRYEEEHGKEGTGGQILDRAVEMTGKMAGSPTTYIVPGVGGLALKGAGAIGGAALKATIASTPMIYGAASGVEEAKAQQNMGVEASALEEGAVGAAGGLVGGGLGYGLSRAATKLIKPQIAGRIAGDVSGMAGFGTGQTAVSTADAIRRDPDQDMKKLIKEQGIGLAASSLTGIPGMLPSLHAPKHAPEIAKKYGRPVADVEAALASYENIKRAEMAAARKMGDKVDLSPKLFQDKSDLEHIEQKFKQHEAETRGERPGVGFKDYSKKSAGFGGELFVDKNYAALSGLYDIARKERMVIVDGIIEGQKRKAIAAGKSYDEVKARAAIEDKMTKGHLPAPISEQLAKAIEAEPTLLQNAIHNANEVISKIYGGLSTEQSTMLNRYVTAKNQVSIERRKDHTPPKGFKKGDFQRIVDTVEGNPDNEEIIKRAEDIWALSKYTVNKEYEMGKISAAERDNLLKTPFYVPTKLIPEFHPFRVMESRDRTAGEGDPFHFLESGTRAAIDMNVGELLHNRLVQSEMSEHKHKRLTLLAQMADDRVMGMRRSETDKVAVGEAAIPYMVEGKTEYIIVPDWFKRSLEVNGVDSSTKMMQFLGLLFGSTLRKKFAVQWNPEFSLANFPRDFQRNFRMMAIAADSNAPLGKMLWENNPVKYTVEMTKCISAVARNFKNWKEYARENGALRGRMTMDYDGNIYAKKGERAKRRIDEVLGFAGAISEDTMRIAAFKMLIDKGFTPKKAGQLVGEFLDYNRKGVLSGAADVFSPFFNVAVQAPRADIRILKANPKAYAIRQAYTVSTAALVSAALYATFGDSVDEQINTRDKESALHIPLSQNKDGSFNVAKFYFDQQDRLPWAVGDSIARLSQGRQVDTDRLYMAMEDYVSVPISLKKYEPATMQAMNILSGKNMNDYTGMPYSFTPAPMPENFDAAIDPKRDHPVSIAISQGLNALGIKAQPALIAGAFKTLIPTGFMENAGMYLWNAASGEADPRKIPMVRKIVRQTDEELPQRKIMHEGEVEKNRETLERWADKRRMQMLDDEEYLREMNRKIREERNPFEKKRLAREMKETYRDRIVSGKGASTKKYLLYKVSPSQYEAVDEQYRKLKGQSLTEDPRLLKAIMRQRAQEQYDDDSSE